MITSYFPSESNATIAYTNFSPSGRCAYPGDSSNTAFGVIFGNAPSFSVSIISPIDSRISFIAIHMRISSFWCPFSAEGPARRENPSPVWRRTWRRQVSRGSRLFAVSGTHLFLSLRSGNESRNKT